MCEHANTRCFNCADGCPCDTFLPQIEPLPRCYDHPTAVALKEEERREQLFPPCEDCEILLRTAQGTFTCLRCRDTISVDDEADAA